MQLMPGIVVDANAALGTDYAPGDAHRPEVGVRPGAWHLGKLVAYYDGDAVLTLMAYNAGVGNVDAWRQEATGQDLDDLLRFVPYGETREYVSRVSLNYLIYRTLYGEVAGDG
jgi:soluble lytic murein transglycosylase